MKVQTNLIAFDGLDGSGKSSLIKALLEHKNTSPGIKTVSLVRANPLKNSPYGKQARSLLGSTQQFRDVALGENFSISDAISLNCILDFYYALNYSKGVEESLDGGYARYVYDRYLISTLVYLEPESSDIMTDKFDIIWRLIRSLNLPFPEYYYVLLIGPEEIKARLQSRDKERELYEDTSKMHIIHSRFLQVVALLMEEFITNIYPLDAKKSIKELVEEVHSFGGW